MKTNVTDALTFADIQQKSLPWELTLIVRGEKFSVKPLTNADIAQLGLIQAAKNLEEVRAVLNGLWIQPAPAVELSADEVAASLLAISIGFQEHVKKKSQLLERGIRASMANATIGS